jgi:hypothetical protein
MGRLAMLLLIVSLVANPNFRERVGPYASFALDPAYGWLTRSRVGEIARALDTQESRGKELPTTATLPDFLAAHFGGPDSAVDPWGSRYFFARDMWTTRVASAGPDRAAHTADDILSEPLHSHDF